VTAATKGIAEHDVMGWAAKRQAVIIVIDDVVLEYYIRALHVETYRKT